MSVFYTNYIPGNVIDLNWKSISVDRGGYGFNLSGNTYPERLWS